MNKDFVRDRISELRLKKGVSEYQMSMDLGQSKGYIQGISTGRSQPSLGGFFNICEYFGVTPRDFFDDDQRNPALLQEAIDALKTLSDDDIALLLATIRRFQKN